MSYIYNIIIYGHAIRGRGRDGEREYVKIVNSWLADNYYESPLSDIHPEGLLAPLNEKAGGNKVYYPTILVGAFNYKRNPNSNFPYDFVAFLKTLDWYPHVSFIMIRDEDDNLEIFELFDKKSHNVKHYLYEDEIPNARQRRRYLRN